MVDASRRWKVCRRRAVGKFAGVKVQGGKAGGHFHFRDVYLIGYKTATEHSHNYSSRNSSNINNIVCAVRRASVGLSAVASGVCVV